MTKNEIELLAEAQKKYFASGATLPLAFRRSALKKLKLAILAFCDDICAALKADLGKSPSEAYMCEIGPVISEINYMLRRLSSLAKEKTVKTPITQFAARSYKKPSPYGNTLIMSPWNYPFLLTVDPLVDAIAAGNTAIVKPSAYSPETSALIERMLAGLYEKEYVAVVTGGREENSSLLGVKFDLVFFTGSQAVGKEVLRHTAETLTPAVLELGGKSPCIVDSTAKLKLAAKRIVFGKYLNLGQTCVAPDYVLCHTSIKDALVHEICVQIKKQFGSDPLNDPDYGRIVNEKHFYRLQKMLINEKIAIGGHSDASTLRIEPTVLDNSTWSDPAMCEEIFGPILPILTFDSIEEVRNMLAYRPKPLALYIFSESRRNIRLLTEGCSFGGGCVNDVVIHLATSEMGFGGVGESGMGSYHGRDGFNAFSHTKSIVDKKTWMDLPLRYRPYCKLKDIMIKTFLK